MTRRRRKALVSLILGLLALCLSWSQKLGYLQPLYEQAQVSQPGLYRVTKFVDGDTIAVDMQGTTETVRLIGVDTPETHDPRKSVQCFGQAAAQFTKTFIGSNRVRLEADPTNTNRDRYNRLLRYVYLPDGRMVNAEIIKQGFGFAYTYFPFEKLEAFKQYQREAEQNGQGLWSQCSVITEDSGQVHTD